MEKHKVTLDHWESNKLANNLSITGKVDGVQCAVVIKLSSIEGLPQKAAKRVKQLALIDAFTKKKESVPESEGEEVEV